MDIFHQPLRNRFFDSLNTPYYLIVAVLLRPWIGRAGSSARMHLSKPLGFLRNEDSSLIEPKMIEAVQVRSGLMRVWRDGRNTSAFHLLPFGYVAGGSPRSIPACRDSGEKGHFRMATG